MNTEDGLKDGRSKKQCLCAHMDMNIAPSETVEKCTDIRVYQPACCKCEHDFTAAMVYDAAM